MLSVAPGFDPTSWAFRRCVLLRDALTASIERVRISVFGGGGGGGSMIVRTARRGYKTEALGVVVCLPTAPASHARLTPE